LDRSIIKQNQPRFPDFSPAFGGDGVITPAPKEESRKNKKLKQLYSKKFNRRISHIKTLNWESFALPHARLTSLLSTFGWQDNTVLRGTKTCPTRLAKWEATGKGASKMIFYIGRFVKTPHFTRLKATPALMWCFFMSAITL
jgi:hypothetical protein